MYSIWYVSVSSFWVFCGRTILDNPYHAMPSGICFFMTWEMCLFSLKVNLGWFQVELPNATCWNLWGSWQILDTFPKAYLRDLRSQSLYGNIWYRKIHENTSFKSNQPSLSLSLMLLLIFASPVPQSTHASVRHFRMNLIELVTSDHELYKNLCKHHKVEVNNIQFLKINMSRCESSRNTHHFMSLLSCCNQLDVYNVFKSTSKCFCSGSNPIASMGRLYI